MKNIALSMLSLGVAALFLSLSSWTSVVLVSVHPDNLKYINEAPEIAVDAFGNSYVTWQGYDGNDKEIYWAKIDSTGTLDTVKKISTHENNEMWDDYKPKIAVDASGGSYVVWYGSTGDGFDVYWMKIDASGATEAFQRITAHPENANFANWNSQFVVDTSGNSYLTWCGSDGNNSDIYWVKIDRSGVPRIVQKISTHPDDIDHHCYDPQIAIDASGNSYVVWHGCDKENCGEEPGDLEIYWVKIDGEGIPGAVQKIPPTDPDNINIIDEIPQIAVDAEGNSFVVWCGMNEKDYDIYWARIDGEGIPGAVQEISTHQESVYSDRFPQCAVDMSGNSYVTWQGYDGDDAEIYWARIDNSGTPGIIKKVSAKPENLMFNDFAPRISLDTEGNSYIVWQCAAWYLGRNSDDIYWAKMNSSGVLEKIEKLPDHPNSSNDDWRPQIAVDASGNSYVVWEGDDTSDMSKIFFTAHLPGPTLTVGTIVIIAIVALAIIGIILACKKIRQVFKHSK